MQKIIPCLWYDDQAEEAVEFYTSVFGDSHIGRVAHYGKAGQEIHGQKPGSVMTVDFEIEGQSFMALNGGPIFKFNPSISFLVNCKTEEELNQLWNKLSEGGLTLMELGEYPFSQRYGWTQDKYGVSWQVMWTKEEIKQKIVPTLMFVGNAYGRAAEAIGFYTSLFRNARVDHIMRYEADEKPDKEGTVKHAAFRLDEQQFAVMDSAHEHKFSFNEAVSFVINCQTQHDIDYYWKHLSEDGDPAVQQCGWLKDKFGVSWQVVPQEMSKWFAEADPQKADQLMDAMLKMKKLDIEKLKASYER